MKKTSIRVFAALVCAWTGPALAGSVAGVCPDGSAFIVSRKASAPCARARFVDDPSDMPPLRPELLPRPYTWTLDQRARDPNNPYNLLEATRKMNARHEPTPAPSAEQTAPEPQVAAVPPTRVQAGSPEPLSLPLHEDEVRDLVRLVTLRQEVAPATFTVEDIHQQPQLLVRLAHSQSFQDRVLDVLGQSDKHVLLFSVRSVQAGEFYPNFFLVHEGVTFRPDPEDSHEVGFIVGDRGELEAGYLALGYLIIPQRFDPSQPLEIWWNDRSLVGVLRP